VNKIGLLRIRWQVCYLFGCLIGLLLLASCAGGGGQGGGGDQESVTLRLDFAIDGLHAPFFVAQEKGWYEEEGLDVNIVPGQGSADTVKVTGAGRSEFGVADAATMSTGVSQDVPVKMVAVILRESPAVTVSLKGSGIEQPTDLRGKSIGDAQQSSTATLLPAFLNRNGMDPEDVKFVGMGFESRVPALLDGNVDAILGFIQEFVNIQDQVNFMPWYQHGIDAYSSGIIVNEQFLEENPETVRAFVAASIRGLEYTIQHRQEAAQIVAKAAQAEPGYFAGELELLDPLFKDEDVQEHGFGWMSKERWTATQNLMLEYGGQQKKKPLSDLFSNDYLPDSS
jgi:NitT/TauT family transport system substrate-binding protein